MTNPKDWTWVLTAWMPGVDFQVVRLSNSIVSLGTYADTWVDQGYYVRVVGMHLDSSMTVPNLVRQGGLWHDHDFGYHGDGSHWEIS